MKSVYNPLSPMPLDNTPDSKLWALYIYSVFAAFILVSVSTNRSMFEAPHFLDMVGSYSKETKDFVAQTAYRVGLVLVGSASLFCIAYSTFVRIPRPRISHLYCAAISLSLSFVLCCAFGQVPEFVPAAAVIPLTLLAPFHLPAVKPDYVKRLIFRGAVTLALGSLVSTGVASAWSLEQPYTGSLVPGIDFRLHGLSPHANTLAPIMLIGAIVGLYLPLSRLRVALIGLMLLVLLFTQSKTTIVCGVVVAPILLSHLLLARVNGSLRATIIAWSYLCGAALIFCLMPLVGETRDDRFLSLTGRTDIWSVTLAVWQESPIWGYGPNLWDEAMQSRLAWGPGWLPSSAHNQLLQSLGQSGLIGLLAWCYFLVSMALVIRNNADPQSTAAANGAHRCRLYFF
jgi:O-antigen ligase